MPVDFSDLGGQVVQAAPSNQTFDFSDLGGKVVQAAQGQVRNDVGNTVIVPKQGESFADTMKRAAAYGRTVTPEQINAEVRTMPAKAAMTLAAAPAIGAVGAAGLTAADMGAYQAVKGAGYAVEALKDILPEKATMDQIIKVGKIVRDLSLTTAAGKYLYHQIYGNE